MGLTKYYFRDLIAPHFISNSDGLFGEDDTIGVNIDKEIRKMRGDSSKKELRTFYVVGPGDFVFNPRGSRKLGLGFNDTNNTYITTFNNVVFNVKDNSRKYVLPKYLYIYLSRKEWDRKAEFSSWGTSTEVFSWDTLCEMELYLPSIPIQQKFVDIYNGMVANQQSYEHGLEDLKLAIDAELDRIKHSSSMRPVGELLKEIDNRNTNGDMDNVQGINIAKQFMPSVADTNGVNLNNYKVVKKGQFAYSGMQTGRDECIRIALYTEEEPILISPAYSVFEVKDQSVLAEYIMMWFSRAESDRRGWFMSDASIRTNLDLERLYEIMVPIPNLPLQQSMVELYSAYQTRRAISEKLKSQIKDICPILIKGSLEEENDRLRKAERNHR